MLERGATALDVRPSDQFAAGHVPGSVNIPLSGQFASWAGAVLGLVSRSGADRRNCRAAGRGAAAPGASRDRKSVRLSRRRARRLAAGGIALQQLPQITVQELASRLRVDASAGARRPPRERIGGGTYRRRRLASAGSLQGGIAGDRARRSRSRSTARAVIAALSHAACCNGPGTTMSLM